VISLVGELCDVLDYVANFTDEQGVRCPIIHRDLSPSNLIVGDDGHLHVIDFGVAKMLGGKFMTNTGHVRGKLGYLAPEVIAGGSPDPRADIFSAGVVMWELLVGRRLFSGRDELDVIDRIRNGPIDAPSAEHPECPAELDEIVMHALARDPSERWGSAAAMRAALDSMRRRCQGSTPRNVVWWTQELNRADGDTETLATRDLEELMDEGALDQGTADLELPDEITKPEVDVKIYFNHNDGR
jgi:serine/threonine protein kinase